MLTQSTVWIPSHLWNRWFPDRNKEPKEEMTTIAYSRQPSPFSRLLQLFLLGYMIYNFAGERKWIRKHDNGE